MPVTSTLLNGQSAECLDWELTPVLTDDQAGPLIVKAYS